MSATPTYSAGTIHSESRSYSGTSRRPANAKAESGAVANTSPSAGLVLHANPAAAETQRLTHNTVPPGLRPAARTDRCTHRTVPINPRRAAGNSASQYPTEVRIVEGGLPGQLVVGAEGCEPETSQERHLECRAAAVSAPPGGEQKQRARRRDQHRAIRQPESDRGRQPPDGRAARPPRGVGFDRPDSECGQQQCPEDVAGVVFDLERIVREPLADRAQEHQRRRAGRSQPSSTDPQRNRQGRDPEEQRAQDVRRFRRCPA